MRRGISFSNKRYRLICSLILFLLIISYHAWSDEQFAFAAEAHEAPSPLPRAVRGHIDALGFDFSVGTLALDGEWEFYFGTLLQPEYFLSDTATRRTDDPPGYFSVPGSWQTAANQDEQSSRHGVATYRLHVTGLPLDALDALALEIPYARTAYRLWVNGQLVASNGTVSPDLDEVRPQYRPTVVHLSRALVAAQPVGVQPVGVQPVTADTLATQLVIAESDGSDAFTNLDIVMQVANVDFRAGGIPKSIMLGLAEKVGRERAMRLMSQLLLIGALGLMAIFYGMMYVWRSVESSVLYFALLSANVALRSFMTGELPVMTVFPDLSWHWLLRIEYVTSFAAPMFFQLFLHALFPQDVFHGVKRVTTGVGVIGMAAALILPVHHTSLLMPYNSVLMTILFPYVGVVLVRAAWKRREASEFTLIGGLVFLGAMGLTLFHYNRSWTDLELVPFAVFALFVSQGMALSRRYALAFRRSAALAQQNGILLAETRRQFKEHKRLHRLLTEQDEQTRREIAELLHGRTQTRLFAASRSAAEAAATVSHDPHEAADIMRSVEKTLEQVRKEEIRDASHRLHPAAIRAGLIGALDALCARWEDHFDVDFWADPELEALDDPAEGGLSEGLRLGLYRIADEALNNIYRHAQAKRVRLSIGRKPASPSMDILPTRSEADPSLPPTVTDLATQGACVELMITDDGIGFDPEAVQAGLGLQLITARTADLSGDVALTSKSGRGTTLRVVVPVQ